MTSRTIEMEQTTDINSLPDHAIVTIFKFLSREDRKKLSLVNKRFHAIYKYQAGLKFAFVLDLGRYRPDEELTKVAAGMKILRENQRPFDQLTITTPTFTRSKPFRELIYCQKILSDLEESISRENAQKVEYIVLHGGYDFFMIFLRIIQLFPRLKSVGYSYYDANSAVLFKIKESPYTVLDKKLRDVYKNQIEDLIAPKVEEFVVFTESLSGFSRCINNLLKICPNIKKIRCIKPKKWYLTVYYDENLREEIKRIDQKSYRDIERTFEVSQMTSNYIMTDWIVNSHIRLFSMLEERENHRSVYKMTADDVRRGELRRFDEDTRKRIRRE